jgi:chemotaxis protein MotB
MRFATMMLVLSLLSACGHKAEIEGLELLLSEARTKITERDATLAERDATIVRLEGEVSALTADVEALRADLALKGEEVDRLGAELDGEREKSSRILADRGALRGEVAAMKEALEELQLRKRQAEARVQQFRDLVARFQSLIDAGTLEVRMIDGRMVVVLATDILFASGSADLSADGGTALAQVAAVLAGIPGRRYQVEGHTDDVPIKSARFPSNWYLAAARSIGVVNHMVASGLGADVVSAAAFAETRPVASNADADGRAKNRRIEIVVVPDLSDLPGYDELQDL